MGRSMNDITPEGTELAQVLFDRTGGNLFYSKQMVEVWQSQGLLQYNFVTGKWECKQPVGHIRRSTLISENVADVLCHRLETTLPENIQQLLQMVAILQHGVVSRIDRHALELFIGNEQLCTVIWGDCESGEMGWRSALHTAIDESHLIQVTNDEYRFSHNKIQEACYQSFLHSLSDNKHISTVAELHRKIGLLVLEDIKDLTTVDDGILYACADQLRLGLVSGNMSSDAPMDSRQPRLFFEAGTRASKQALYELASKFLHSGIETLEQDHSDPFQGDYQLAMDLFVAYGKAEISCGRNITSRLAAEKATKNAMNEADKIRAMMILLRACCSGSDFDEIVDVALSMLEALGEPTFARNPIWLQLRWETEKALKALRTETLHIDDISDLPHMDEKKTMVMKILHAMLGPAILLNERHKYFIIVTSRMLLLTLNHGICKWSAAALSSFALCILGYKERTKEALFLAECSIKLVESIPSQDIGTALGYSGIVMSIEPSRKFLELIRKGFSLCLESGNVTEAFTGLTYYNLIYYVDGAPLKPLLSEMEVTVPKMVDYNQTDVFLMNKPLWDCLLNITARSSATDEDINNRSATLRHCQKGKQYGVGDDVSLTYSMEISFYLGDTDAALQFKSKIDDESSRLIAKHCPFSQARLLLYAVVAIGKYRETGKRRFLVEAKRLEHTLKSRVEKGFIKLLHKYQIVSAELHSFSVSRKQSSKDVLQLYNTAIISSTKSGYLQDAALANTLCGQFCLRHHELKASADMYFHKSADLFTACGAIAVADSIVQRHPASFPDHRFKSTETIPISQIFQHSMIARSHATPEQATFGDAMSRSRVS